MALRFLRRNGYKILYRNFRGRSGGEIDIVCRDNDTLVFVEVKTRTREDFGRPVAAVDRQKQKRISRGGLAWLRMLDNPDILFRFDVVETPPRIDQERVPPFQAVPLLICRFTGFAFATPRNRGRVRIDDARAAPEFSCNRTWDARIIRRTL